MFYDQASLQLVIAFLTIFSIFGLGYIVQRLRPMSEVTLSELSELVVNVLIPIFLFFVIANNSDLRSVEEAPLLILAGIGVSVTNYALGRLAVRPLQIGAEQKSAFRFSVMYTNTTFLAMPICGLLFGPVGMVYAVLYEFGANIVTLTLGIWELKGGKFANWSSFFLNPLIWGVAAGFVWSLMGWSFPGWAIEPFEILGGATLPLALLIGGAKIATIRSQNLSWRRQLTGLTFTRLIISPLVVGIVLLALGWRNMVGSVAIIQAAMPVGITASMMAKAYGADSGFAASATLWSTMSAVITSPIIILILSVWFPV